MFYATLIAKPLLPSGIVATHANIHWAITDHELKLKNLFAVGSQLCSRRSDDRGHETRWHGLAGIFHV